MGLHESRSSLRATSRREPRRFVADDVPRALSEEKTRSNSRGAGEELERLTFSGFSLLSEWYDPFSTSREISTEVDRLAVGLRLRWARLGLLEEHQPVHPAEIR